MTWEDYKKQREPSKSSGASWDNYLTNRSKRIEEQEREEKERLEKQRQREEQLAKQRESVIFKNNGDFKKQMSDNITNQIANNALRKEVQNVFQGDIKNKVNELVANYVEPEKDLGTVEETWLTKEIGKAGLKTGHNALVQTGKGLLDFGESINEDLLQAGSSKLNPFMWVAADFDSKKLEQMQDISKEIIKEDASEKMLDALGYNKKLSNGKTVQEILDEGSLVKSDNLLGQAFRSGGTMLPSLMAGDPKVGLKILGASAYGSGLEEAYQNDASRMEANIYATLNTAIEMGSESLGGMLGSNPVSDKLRQSIEQKISSSLSQKLLNMGLDMAEEGFEELLGDLMSPIAQKITYASEEDLMKLYSDQDYFNDFLTGGLTAGIMGTGSTVMQIKMENSIKSQLKEDLTGRNKNKLKNELVSMGFSDIKATRIINEVLEEKGLKPLKTNLVVENNGIKINDVVLTEEIIDQKLEELTSMSEDIKSLKASKRLNDAIDVLKVSKMELETQAAEKINEIVNYDINEMSEKDVESKVKEIENVLQNETPNAENKTILESNLKKLEAKQEQMVKVQEEQKELTKDTSQDTQQLEKTIQESEAKLEELKSNQTQNEDQVKKLEQELSTLESKKENKDLAKQISKQRVVVEEYQERFNKEQKTFGFTEDTLKLGKQVNDAKTYLQKLIDQQKQEKLNKEQKINEIKKQIDDLKSKDNTKEIKKLEKETETNKKQLNETEEKLSKDEIGADIENSNNNSNELEIKNKSAIVLEEMPKDMEKAFNKIKKSYEITKKNLKKISSKLINSWNVIQEMDRKRGKRSLGAALNLANDASGMATNAIKNGVYDFKGNKLSEGVQEIFKKIDKTYENNYRDSMSKKEYRQIVGDYVYASRQATQADDRMPIIGDANSINRILEINKEINTLSQDVGNTNEIKKLSEEKLKITRELIEDAKQIVKEIETDYPEVKDFKKDVLDYEKALREVLKDAGFLTQEQSDEMEQAYPEYVRVYRNVKKSGEYVPKKYENMFKKSEAVSINSPIYSTKGSTADILPLEKALIKQTENVYRASTRNMFAKELYNTMGGLNSNVRKEAIKDGIINYNTGDKALIFYDKGNTKVIPIANEIADAINPKRIEFGALGKFLEKESSLTRDLITNLSPIFALRNLASDLSDAPINSQHSALYLKNMGPALAMMMTNSKLFQQYKGMGGYNTTIFDYDKSFRDKNIATKALGSIPGAVEFLGNNLEHYTRFVEFVASIEAGDSMIEALYNADEVTGNFKKGGQLTKTAGRLGFNYINAKVLGMYKAYENIANHKGGKEMLKLITKASIFGILPSLLNELLWHDDDDYEELSDSVKNKYYVFKIGDTLYKIPKGHITRVISAIPETTFRGTLDGKSLQESLSESLSTGVDFALDETDLNNWKIWESHSLWPLVNLMINKDKATNYFGSSIIPNRYKKKTSTLEDQWNDPGVTKSSIGLSKWAKETFGWEISPFVLDYLGDQKLGVVWDFAEPLMTNEPDKMAWEAAFTADTRVNNRYNDELEKRVNKTPKTDDEIVLNKYYSSKQYDMWDKYAEIRDVGRDENLSESEKREKVDEIRNRMNQIAKDTLNITDKNIVNKTVGGVKYKQINAGNEIYSYKYDEKNNTWKKVYTKK